MPARQLLVPVPRGLVQSPREKGDDGDVVVTVVIVRLSVWTRLAISKPGGSDIIIIIVVAIGIHVVANS